MNTKSGWRTTALTTIESRARSEGPREELRHQVRRILLALDSIDDQEALEAAAELAVVLRGSLQGLFVQNAGLLKIASLPFAQEIALTSAAARRLEVEGLERALRAQVSELRRLMGSLAGRRRIEWSLSVVRGVLPAAALAASAEADLYIVGRPRSPYRTGVRQIPGPLLVSFEDTPAGLHAIEAAVELSRLDGELIVALRGDSSEATAALRRVAEAVLERGGVHARILTVALEDIEALANLARDIRARLLVAGESESVTDPAKLGALLRLITCPVVITR